MTLTYNIAAIAFFCGLMCKLEMLCNKRVFFGNWKFYR